MTPLERAARAICKARYLNGGIEEEDGWDECRPELRTEYFAQASAVLTAIREPSEAMWRAGADSIDGFDRLERPHAYAIEAKGTWQAMIDAALTEGSTD